MRINELYPRHEYLRCLVSDVEANLVADKGVTDGAIQAAIELGKVKSAIEYADSGEVSLSDCAYAVMDFLSAHAVWMTPDKYKEYLSSNYKG